ncbi:hypothetical protein BJ322DRAFT_1024725 [Thelephora terrestris]|uniref:Uncharacterized protein n=1 Tax=Thelephora terrestris TaxID=56493 RepID=A0A9P6H459_9AGAM|nr:hypothetical protein BJ322DRAFT_1024725 [Thelephora terrestris]
MGMTIAARAAQRKGERNYTHTGIVQIQAQTSGRWNLWEEQEKATEIQTSKKKGATNQLYSLCFFTRLPRFTQLFFHDFEEHELTLSSGQSLTSTSSQRAARAYLLSGIRLESKCGLSDAWYSYVEAHSFLFQEIGRTPLKRSLVHPYPVLSPEDAATVYKSFTWEKQHKRPKPARLAPLPAGARVTPQPFAVRSALLPPAVISKPRSSKAQERGSKPTSHKEGDSTGKEEPAARKEGRSARKEQLSGEEPAVYTSSVKVKKEEEEMTDLEFGSWPTNPSFNKELFRAIDDLEHGPGADELEYVPSTMPEEEELVLPSHMVTGTVDIVDHPLKMEVLTEGVPMEGVELSQPTGGHSVDSPQERGEDWMDQVDVWDADDEESMEEITDPSDEADEESMDQVTDPSDGDEEESIYSQGEIHKSDDYCSILYGRPQAYKGRKDILQLKLRNTSYLLHMLEARDPSNCAITSGWQQVFETEVMYGSLSSTKGVQVTKGNQSQIVVLERR